MKKTCDKCKALEDGGKLTVIYRCELGYTQQDGVPLEDCPKPLSTKKFVELLINKERQKLLSHETTG